MGGIRQNIKNWRDALQHCTFFAERWERASLEQQVNCDTPNWPVICDYFNDFAGRWVGLCQQYKALTNTNISNAWRIQVSLASLANGVRDGLFEDCERHVQITLPLVGSTLEQTIEATNQALEKLVAIRDSRKTTGTLQDQLADIVVQNGQAQADPLAEDWAGTRVDTRFLPVYPKEEQALQTLPSSEILTPDQPYGFLRTPILWSRPWLESHSRLQLERLGFELDWSLGGYLVVANQALLGISRDLLHLKWGKTKECLHEAIGDLTGFLNKQIHITKGITYMCMGRISFVGGYFYQPLMPTVAHEGKLTQWTFLGENIWQTLRDTAQATITVPTRNKWVPLAANNG